MKQYFFFVLVILLIACNENREESVATSPDTTDSTSAESKEERNKKTIMASIEAMNAHNVNDALKDVAPDVVDYGDGSGPPLKSVDSVNAMLTTIIAAFPDYKGENLVYIADGDHVVVLGEWSGTFKNDLGKMKATGKKFKLKDADIFTFNDEGKVVEHRSIQPNSTLFSQIGVKMNR